MAQLNSSSKALAVAALGGFAAGGACVVLSRRLRELYAGITKPEVPVKEGRVPIFVMMPLDTVTSDGKRVHELETRKAWLAGLRKSGVRGIMVDVWWGLCEPRAGEYCFDGYLALCALCRELDLRVQAVMSFHQCGGNVGDSVTIPVPSWAMDVAEPKGLLYKDGCGRVSKDCLSLSADREAIFPVGQGKSGMRTALDCYGDFMVAFAAAAVEFLGSTIVEIQVGMGPCGELRYPSYMLSEGWNYPGVGLICAHDAGMLKMMKGAGISSVPKGEPKDQNGKPSDCAMFAQAAAKDDAAFLQWYRETLLRHGEDVLRKAVAAFPVGYGSSLAFSVKVSGIHWHTMHPSRAAEACAGYVPDQDSGYGAYARVASMLAKVAKDSGRPMFFNFTCLEMQNGANVAGDDSAPEDLIAEVRRACIAYGVPLCGENALQFGLPESPWALDQIRKQARGWAGGDDRMHSITLLRLDEGFARPTSFSTLREWISSL